MEMKLKLKGKPRCPLCGKPLFFVYEGSQGYSSAKCERCRQPFLVNTATLEVIKAPKEAG